MAVSTGSMPTADATTTSSRGAGPESFPMRLLVELAVVAALIVFGWHTSFSSRLGLAPAAEKTAAKAPAARRAAAVPPPTARPVAAAPKPTAPPDNSWMWDPNRKGSLDRKTSPQPRRP